MSTEWFVTLAVAALGAVMGSAVSALSWRLPRGRSWVRGRSACSGCGHVLGALDLVPLLSWTLSRGRCRHCGARIGARYPVIELTCATWSVLVLRLLGLTPALPIVLIWGYLLVALLWIDLDFQLLPDALTLPGTVLGVAAGFMLHGGRETILGMALGSGMLWGIGELYYRVRKIEGMGGGDVKLAAMFGALLGAPGAVLTLMLASLVGALWGGVLIARGRGDGKTALPFGTFLCPAAMIAFLWGEGWVRAYLGLFRG